MARFVSIEPGLLINLDQVISIHSQSDEIKLKMSDGSQHSLSKEATDRFWELLHAEGGRILDGVQPEAETICDLEIPTDLLSFGSD